MFGLENSNFLINLAVSLLIALITLLYFRQQLATLDHKVNSMFSLMTSMTQELNNLSRLNLIQDGNNEETMRNNFGEEQQQTGGYDQRINVSDSEEDNDSESSEEEDFWLPRREGGRGTEISTLPGGENLGQIEDTIYFQKRLYI